MARIADGPHYAVGYNIDAPYRTGADGEVWAFKDQTVARDYLVESFGDTTTELDMLEGLTIAYHDRPTKKCMGCIMVTTPGEYAELRPSYDHAAVTYVMATHEFPEQYRVDVWTYGEPDPVFTARIYAADYPGDSAGDIADELAESLVGEGKVRWA